MAESARRHSQRRAVAGGPGELAAEPAEPPVPTPESLPEKIAGCRQLVGKLEREITAAQKALDEARQTGA